MKDFYGDYVQDPIIENVHNSDNDLSGKMFKFSSGYAVFVGIYTTKNSTSTKQGNITISGDENIHLSGLGFTSVLGGSINKNGYETNNAIFGSFFGQEGIRTTLFRGDSAMYSGVKLSIVIFGFWK
jgi:hypothetical protein